MIVNNVQKKERRGGEEGDQTYCDLKGLQSFLGVAADFKLVCDRFLARGGFLILWLQLAMNWVNGFCRFTISRHQDDYYGVASMNIRCERVPRKAQFYPL